MGRSECCLQTRCNHHTHEFTKAMVTCTRPSQGQDSQNPSTHEVYDLWTNPSLGYYWHWIVYGGGRTFLFWKKWWLGGTQCSSGCFYIHLHTNCTDLFRSLLMKMGGKIWSRNEDMLEILWGQLKGKMGRWEYDHILLYNRKFSNNKKIKLQWYTSSYPFGWQHSLFTRARNWKQNRCLSIDEWTQKISYIYKTEYYSAVKNEIRKFTGKGIEVKKS